MATVTLKNVPEGLLHALRELAQRNRRSLNQEALLRLEASVAPEPRRSGAETVRALRRLHRRLSGIGPITDEFLQAAKTEGRR